MSFLEKIKTKATIKKAQNIKYDKLIQDAEYILSICVNGIRVTENGDVFWHHSLPLKDDIQGEVQGLNEDNWDIPDKKEVSKILSQLNDYCSIILDLFYRDNMLIMTEGIHILPPWFVFPLYNGNSPGWRQGSGEAYMEVYIYYLRHLSDYDFERYDKRFPTPEYMNTNMFTLNLINYNLKYNK